MISIIASVGRNNELGYKNNLIWHIPDDLSFFREKTLDKKIVMGYNTYKSLPKVLSRREYIVLTHHKIDDDHVMVYSDINELISKNRRD